MGPEVTLQSTPQGQAALPTLALQNVSKHFGGERALDHVDFTILPGEVHGLLGQNGSGKSTLIKILAGVHEPDPGGRLFINGEPVRLPLTAGQFRQYGISFVHQNLALVPTLTATENLLIGELATTHRWWVSAPTEERRAEAIFRHFDVQIDPAASVEALTPVQRALLAIVRAMTELPQQADGGYQGCLLVLDEPTPFLPRHDVDVLFTLIRGIVGRGASVIFVSHDVDEVLEITDRATILRDGQVVGTIVTPEVTKEEIVERIIGRRLLLKRRPPTPFADAPPLVTLTAVRGRRMHDLDLNVRAGEIVGLTGLVGSGYDEVPYLLYGAVSGGAGTMTLGPTSWSLQHLSPSTALQGGIVLIPGDRPAQGVVLDLTVLDNLTVPLLDDVWCGWRLNWPSLRTTGQTLLKTFHVKPQQLGIPISSLSGGNQQKVVLAKWFQTNPQLILLDEPTQGVDVGAREEVYIAIRQAAQRGAAVLCASSEYEQLALLCDRVLIFHRGRVAHELHGDELNKDNIARHCYSSFQDA